VRTRVALTVEAEFQSLEAKRGPIP
jgi:hypothetical protein